MYEAENEKGNFSTPLQGCKGQKSPLPAPRLDKIGPLPIKLWLPTAVAKFTAHRKDTLQ